MHGDYIFVCADAVALRMRKKMVDVSMNDSRFTFRGRAVAGASEDVAERSPRSFPPSRAAP